MNSSVEAVPPRSRVTVFPRGWSSRAPRECALPGHGADVLEQHACRQHERPGFASPFPAMSGAVPCTASKIAPLTPMFAPRREPETTDKSRDLVGENVAEQVCRDDDVEPSGCSTRFIDMASTMRSSNSMRPT